MPPPYEIVIRRSAQKEIRAVADKQQRRRIVARIHALGEDPRPPGAKKLSGRSAHRVRQGRYRIVYVIEDERLIVEVVKVGHRRDVYR